MILGFPNGLLTGIPRILRTGEERLEHRLDRAGEDFPSWSTPGVKKDPVFMKSDHVENELLQIQTMVVGKRSPLPSPAP